MKFFINIILTIYVLSLPFFITSKDVVIDLPSMPNLSYYYKLNYVNKWPLFYSKSGFYVNNEDGKRMLSSTDLLYFLAKYNLDSPKKSYIKTKHYILITSHVALIILIILYQLKTIMVFIKNKNKRQHKGGYLKRR